jgi:tight adherence protein C
MHDMMTELLSDRTLAMLLAAGAVFATIVALALPPEADPRVQARLRMVARERDRLRDRRLSELSAAAKRKVRLEQASPLMRYLGQLRPERGKPEEGKAAGDLTARLRMAGLRGHGPEALFMLFRVATPVLFFALAIAVTVLRSGGHTPPRTALLIGLATAAVGFVAPRLVLDKLIARRQSSILRAFPDALDLLLICVQSGLSVEAALSKVAKDISCQSLPLAEELTLTMAELSYLPVRWKAYANLAARTGVPTVKLITAALMQAERYGTSVSQALTAAAREGREARIAEAERQAASLPPKLAIPLVAFFLPVLLAIILMPALMQASRALKEHGSSFISAPAKLVPHRQNALPSPTDDPPGRRRAP